MANQFQGMYIGKPLKLKYQPEHKSWKVVDPSNPDMFWGGFGSAWPARMYAKHTLGSTDITHMED